jgi:thioredoxin-like negative regulator of GroEL
MHAVDLDPDHIDARRQLAVVLAARGDHEAAWQQIEALLDRQPDHVPARIDGAVLRLTQGCPREALDLIAPVYEAQPHDVRVRYYMASALCGVEDPRGTQMMQQVADADVEPFNVWAAQYLRNEPQPNGQERDA